MKDLTIATDKELVALVQEGDQQAFGELYSRYFEIIRNTLITKTNASLQDAEDLTQLAFIKAMKNISSFENRSTFKTWMYRIAHNTFLDSIKSKKNKAISLEEFNKDSCGRDYFIPDDNADVDAPDVLLAQKENTFLEMDRLNTVKSKLSENQQKIFDLVFVQDKSYKETAEQLGCPIGTVMSRVFFTREKLKKMLKKDSLKN
jgi:RNA polymerase sigma-70 factor (ECF subfamily)